jgi:hypothetical protein
LVAVGNREELLLVHNQGLTEKFDIVFGVETWAWDCFKKSDVGQEISKSYFLVLCMGLGIFAFFNLLWYPNGFEKLHKNFSENIVIFNLSTDDERKWNKIWILAPSKQRNIFLFLLC